MLKIIRNYLSMEMDLERGCITTPSSRRLSTQRMVRLSLVQKRLKNGIRPDLKTLGILTCGSEPLQCMAVVFRIIKYQLPI